MLGGAWLFITALLLLAAVVLRQVPLLLMAVLFFLASGVGRLWSRYALDRVEHSRHLSATRVFFGETLTLKVRLANRKILPLPWLEVQDEMPRQVDFLQGRTIPSYNPDRSILINVVSLGWYHQITREYTIQCRRRGVFAFGPTTISSGDLFGFFKKEAKIEKQDFLTVYPRIVSLEKLGIPSRHPFGDLRVRRHLFEDPVQVMTTREYAYGDPMKRIHWKTSARLQRLHTRVFEHTTTVDLALFLDARTTEPPLWGIDEQLLETAIITASSIASYSVDNGYRVGLYINEPYRFSDRTVRVPPSDHPDQLPRVLDALAQVQGLPMFSLDDLLNTEGRALPWDATITVITAMPTEALLGSLARFRRVGRRVALMVVGSRAPGLDMRGIPIYHVPGDVYWQELEALRLGQATEGPASGGSRYAG